MTLDVLALHRELVAIPSVSGHEEDKVAFVAERLQQPGVRVHVVGRNVVARRGNGPVFLLNSHLDTVPPAADWTREPWDVEVVDGRVYGLGSNDALASVGAMIDTFLAADVDKLGIELVLALVCDEETGGDGIEVVLPWLAERGVRPFGAVVGEPTGLAIASSQKGLMSVDLVHRGTSVHSANAEDLGVTNVSFAMARDLLAIESLDLGPAHADLGRTTIQPTVLRGGEARNRTPAEVRCTLDIRSVPSTSHESIEKLLRETLQGDVEVRSMRLESRACAADAVVLNAARAIRPDARVYGSATMSDFVFMTEWPAIKCGPGETARSHRADEFVLESEILDGCAFYRDLVVRCAEEVQRAQGAAS